jgi:pimeloyl-ACP methyl ester carboxylesterase
MTEAEKLSEEQRAFESALAGDAGFVSSLDEPGNVALVLFGGINKQIGMPPFEFFRLTQDLSVKKIFLRDHEQAWYHRGVRGAGNSIDEVGERLAELLAQANVDKVVMTGNSMGGYAALLFGNLLGATEVVAFSPQTFVSRRRRAVHYDRRWSRQIAAVHSAPSAEPAYFDLAPMFRHYTGSTVFHVHYSTKSRQDQAHARQLRHCPSIVLHPYPDGGHGLAKWLRDSDQLQPILREAVSRLTESD